MKFLLDFDDVLFDTPRLKKKMDELGISEDERSEEVFDVIVQHDPGFSLRELVFPDALHFLEQHTGECVIVSSASSRDAHKNQRTEDHLAFQLKKIVLAGLFDIIGENNVKVVTDSKTEALQELQEKCDEKGEVCLFVDNRDEYVQQAREVGMEALLMDRSAAGMFERPPSLQEGRVTDFEQLAALLETRERKEAA